MLTAIRSSRGNRAHSDCKPNDRIVPCRTMLDSTPIDNCLRTLDTNSTIDHSYSLSLATSRGPGAT